MHVKGNKMFLIPSNLIISFKRCPNKPLYHVPL